MLHITEASERDSRLRSLLKSITYRITGTVATAAIVFAVTGEWATAFAVGFIEPVAKIIIYYLHERAWELVPHGSVHRLFTRRPSGP